MSAGRKQRWGVRIALLVGGMALGLGLVEGALRIVDFRFRLFPERIEFGFPNPVEMQSDFVPDDELLWVQPGYQEKLAEARARRPPLALMGCSCTAWGHFDEVLARRVSEARGQRLDFVNLAFAGWSSFQGAEQMRRDVGPIAPRVVTIFYGWNDHWIGFGVDDATAARLNQSILYPLQRLRIVQLINRLLVKLEGGAASEAGGEVAGEIPTAPQRVAPEDFRRNLEDMVDRARSWGARPVLLTAPTSHREGHEPKYLARRWLAKLEDLVPLHQRYVGIVREVAAAKGVALLDLEQAVAALPAPARNRLFRQDGIHFTEAGDEFVGERLFEFFDEQGLLDVLLSNP